MAKKRIDPKLPVAPVGNESVWARITKALGNVAVDGMWSWLMRADSFGDRNQRRLNELFREQDDGTIAIYDEETYIGQATGLNFTGAGVTAAQAANLSLGNYDITVSGGGGGGGGGDTIEAEADEDIAAGQFVAVFDDSGTPKCRVAKSSSGQGYQADGFCKDAFASGATATIYLPGAVNVAGGTGLTAGDVFLGTGGYATNTAPTTAGYISQQIGVAEDGTSVAFEPHPDILIATPTGITYGGTSQAIEVTSTGTLDIPLGVTGGRLTMVGGGGGGSTRASALGGGGGGAGESMVDWPIIVAAGTSYNVTIGTAGTGAAAAGGAAAGSDGGDTSITIGAQTFTVKGGKGGASNGVGGAGGGISGGTGGVVANPGGNGSNGGLESIVHFGGASGGGGGSATNANGGVGGTTGGFSAGAAGGTQGSTQAGGGGGAGTIWGLGGVGGAGGVAGTSASSTAYGAGGGGAGGKTSSNEAGGNGAKGYLLFEFVA